MKLKRKRISVLALYLSLLGLIFVVVLFYIDNVSVTSYKLSFRIEKELLKEETEECSWWKKELDRWETDIAERISRQEDIEPVKLCAGHELNGIGDRLAGIVGAISMAIETKRPLEIDWEGLNYVFETNYKYITMNTGLCERNNCKGKQMYSCEVLDHRDCFSFDRACFDESKCDDLIYSTDNTSMRHTIGCPLSLILEPRRDFMEHGIKWTAEGIEKKGTVEELRNYVKNQNVLSLHLRMGDKLMSEDSQNRSLIPHSSSRVLNKAEDCLNAVDNWVKSSEKNLNQNGNEVKWLVASDDIAIRTYFMKTSPQKTILLLQTPQHVGQILERNSDEMKIKKIRNLFAEWFLIGSTKELVTNKAHSFGISAFSRSSWLFSARSQYFEINSKDKVCRKREFRYEGNTMKIPKTCRDHVAQRQIPQLHLMYISD